MLMHITLARLKDGGVNIEENAAFGGGGRGRYGGGLERKQLITIRLLTSPPPPCGSFVKIPRSTATADTTSPAKNIIADVVVSVGRERQNSRWNDKVDDSC